MPQEKGTAATPKEAQQEPTPPPAGGEEEDKALPAQKERNPTHRNRDHQRWGPQPKHRLAIVGEREAENRQTEQKRVHHKGSQGIEEKIPKKEQKSLNQRENHETGEKNATSAALRKASRRIGTVIVPAIVANATVARTNATQG